MEGKGEAIAEGLKKLGLGNILSRSHQAFFVSESYCAELWSRTMEWEKAE